MGLAGLTAALLLLLTIAAAFVLGIVLGYGLISAILRLLGRAPEQAPPQPATALASQGD